MNREIKFRAWDKEQSKMRFDLYMSMSNGNYIITSFYDHVADSSNFTLMQFTGLKDKNGKEIYEGDILKSTIDKRWFNWLVSFQHGCFGIQNIGIDGYLMDFFTVTNEYYFSDREVIGNIYENPKLREGKV